ncbi:MAG TPA: S8 family serine peptidase [Pyrinomonadaceae bacterium]|nr:S8 family serine peptidase [Pyrinomonadaceae bacterium]
MKRSCLLLSGLWFVFLASPVYAQVRLSDATLDPAAITSGVATSVTITTLVTSYDPALIPTRINLLRVTQAGKTIQKVGALNDKGVSGDTIRGDGIFGGTFAFNGESPGVIFLRTSAFLGTLKPSLSNVFTLEVAPVGVPTRLQPMGHDDVVTDPASGAQVICNELLVVFKPDTSFNTINDIVSSIGGSITGRQPDLGLYQILLSTCALSNLNAALAVLRANAAVESADKDALTTLTTSFIPNDPRFLDQWSLPRIKVATAWSTIRKGTPIGIIDTGVNYDHEELTGRVTGLDLCGSLTLIGKICVPDSDPRDEQGHGTSVAGLAAALTNNARGIAGVAFDAPIIAVKISYGNQRTFTWGRVLEAILEAVKRGSRVINLSLGSPTPDSLIPHAINYALKRNRIVVAAAGNHNTGDRHYPAAYEGVIAVGASNENNQRAIWSPDLGGPCQGIQSGQASNYGSWVDVYAPGINLLFPRYNDNAGYDAPCASGTSFAAPLVSGTASLLLSARPELSGLQVKMIIRYSSSSTGNYDPEGKELFLLNSDMALQAALATRSLGETSITIVDVPHDRLPDQFPSGLPLEEPGDAVTQNYVAATDDGRFQQTRVFRTTRGMDVISLYRDFFIAQGWTILFDHVVIQHRVLLVRPPGTLAWPIMQVSWDQNTVSQDRSISIDYTSDRINSLIWNNAATSIFPDEKIRAVFLRGNSGRRHFGPKSH